MNLADVKIAQILDQYPWYTQLAVALGLVAVGWVLIQVDKKTGEDDGLLWFAGLIISIAGVFQLWHTLA